MKAAALGPPRGRPLHPAWNSSQFKKRFRFLIFHVSELILCNCV